MLTAIAENERPRGSPNQLPSRSPQVSVIIPAYNASQCIAEALASVFAQTFNNYEVIVVNDGSPDSEELESVLAQNWSRIKYIKQDNRGAASARNTALKVAMAPFVAFLDADDVWLPQFLEEQVQFIGSDGGSDLVYTDAYLFGDPSFEGVTYSATAPSRGRVNSESLLNLRCNVITSGVLARTALILAVGMFDERLRRAHDFDLWLRLARSGARLSYQRKVLLRHRVVMSGLSGDAVSRCKRAVEVFQHIRANHDLTTRERELVDKTLRRLRGDLALEIGKARLMKKDFVDALDSFKEAKSLRRSWKLVIVCLGLRIAPNLLWRVYQARSIPVC